MKNRDPRQCRQLWQRVGSMSQNPKKLSDSISTPRSLRLFPVNVFPIPTQRKADNGGCGVNTEDTGREYRLRCSERLTVGANCSLLLLWTGLRELEYSIQAQHPAQEARTPHFGGGDGSSTPVAGDQSDTGRAGVTHGESSGTRSIGYYPGST